jgi:hypothetical protein
VQLFGPEDAGYLLHRTGKLIGMQYFDETARAFGMGRGGAKQFDEFLRALFEAQDDAVDIGEDDSVYELRQQTWKLMTNVGDYHPACAKVLEGLFEGLAAGCWRHIPVWLEPTAGGKRSSGRSARASTHLQSRRPPMRPVHGDSAVPVVGHLPAPQQDRAEGEILARHCGRRNSRRRRRASASAA